MFAITGAENLALAEGHAHSAPGWNSALFFNFFFVPIRMLTVAALGMLKGICCWLADIERLCCLSPSQR